VEPGSVKVVSVDALPAQIPYVQQGYVEALYAQDCYGWGHKSVEILLEKIVNGKDPESKRIIDPLTQGHQGERGRVHEELGQVARQISDSVRAHHQDLHRRHRAG
jgi:ribose transport system substrate-binding protein